MKAALFMLALCPALLWGQAKAPTPASVVKPTWASTLTKTPVGSFPLLAPCRVTYDLSWNNLMSAGSAKVTMQESGPYQVAKAEAGTSALARALWSYDCVMTSVMERSSLRSLHMEHSETDSRETVAYWVNFGASQISTLTKLSPKKGAVTTSTNICPYGPADDLQSAILYVRSQPLKQGDSITRVVQPFDRPYLTTFTVVGREQKKVEGVAYPTIKLDIKIRKLDRKTLVPGSFKKVKTATIWVSDDAWRLPVEAHAEIFVGFISATMTKREELKGRQAQGALPTGFGKP
ncbi:DUF3108 domain-containing protein [Brevifollis gellanilyticus]|nr:DUF3108 domain-containing protein [Brevifollis gellanilyticus]